MYLKPKSKTVRKKYKRKTAFIVSSVHVLVLMLLFSFFYLKGCTKSRLPNSVKVNIVSANQPQNVQKVIANKKPLIQTKPDKQAKPKNKWKALDPTQIRKSSKTVVRKNSQPQRIVKEINTSAITQNIRKSISSMKLDNSYKTDQSIINYYDEISQFLYSHWDQPSRAAANNGVQVVKVVISVDSNGNIINSKVIGRCGITAIDSSVEHLLSSINSLPKPPNGAEKIEIDLIATPHDF